MKKEEHKPAKTEERVNPFSGRKYIRAVGRRKGATAAVKIHLKGKGEFLVNHKKAGVYFPHFSWIETALSPLSETGQKEILDINAKVNGGGIKSQAEAVRLALARALVLADEKLKPVLRQAGFLTVDARVKERKKPGLKRARRAPQWAKR